MVDNFSLIASIMQFDTPNHFYFLQIIRRAKDVPEIGSNNQFIKAHSIYSVEELMRRKDSIVDLCNKLGARAYIHPSPRNDKVIALMMLEELAAIMRTEQFPNTRNLWATMCGRYTPEKQHKLWIIDHDNDSGLDVETIIRWIDHDDMRPGGKKVRLVVPTKNGNHIITTPFDSQQWNQMYLDSVIPKIDLHRNNPTVLYCP